MICPCNQPGVQYCNRACQKKDWTEGGHRKVCDYYAKLKKTNASNPNKDTFKDNIKDVVKDKKVKKVTGKQGNKGVMNSESGSRPVLAKRTETSSIQQIREEESSVSHVGNGSLGFTLSQSGGRGPASCIGGRGLASLRGRRDSDSQRGRRVSDSQRGSRALASQSSRGGRNGRNPGFVSSLENSTVRLFY